MVKSKHSILQRLLLGFPSESSSWTHTSGACCKMDIAPPKTQPTVANSDHPKVILNRMTAVISRLFPRHLPDASTSNCHWSDQLWPEYVQDEWSWHYYWLATPEKLPEISLNGLRHIIARVKFVSTPLLEDKHVTQSWTHWKYFISLDQYNLFVNCTASK